MRDGDREVATEALIFKGMGRGARRSLSIWIPRDMPLDDLVRDLRERLRASRGFFRGTPVTLQGRELTDEEREIVAKLVAEYGMALVPTQPGEGDVQPSSGEGSASLVGGRRANSRYDTGRPVPAKADNGKDAFSASVVPPDDRTLLVRRTLRSGQRIHYAGNVVILGDVNPGAEVTCTGDIVVVGHLRGVVHAGAEGNLDARVTAFRLRPTQLRIAHLISRPPDDEDAEPDTPEVALVNDGVIEIQAFNPR